MGACCAHLSGDLGPSPWAYPYRRPRASPQRAACIPPPQRGRCRPQFFPTAARRRGGAEVPMPSLIVVVVVVVIVRRGLSTTTTRATGLGISARVRPCLLRCINRCGPPDHPRAGGADERRKAVSRLRCPSQPRQETHLGAGHRRGNCATGRIRRTPRDPF
jgi:hypothetical protein